MTSASKHLPAAAETASAGRRRFMGALAVGLCGAALPGMALAATEGRRAVIGAAWRGPKPDDPYFAGALLADWESRRLSIRYAVPLPTRPHGLIPETDGGLTVVAVRPGGWLLRCDGDGRVVRQARADDAGSATSLNGHALVGTNGDVLYTTETDRATGRGRIGVRERASLRKLAEWDTHGIDPHQAELDAEGRLIVANGGVPRTPADRKFDLHRMDSSLVRLDAADGRLLRQWRLDDPRLSMRHLAWSRPAGGSGARLGVAIQAEHDDAAARATSPVLAVLDDDALTVPTRANDGIGYTGDIAAAYNGGFVLSSNQAGLALMWHPGKPDAMAPLVTMTEAYALAPWHGPGRGGGVLVATALGLVRAHPAAKPLILPWPEPMALDNHWVLMNET